MTFRLFDAPHPDNSSRTGFTGNRLARLSEKRSDTSVTDALGEGRARLLVCGKGNALLKPEGNTFRGWFTQDEALALGADMTGAILLGFEADGAPRLAVPLVLDTENPPADHVAPGIRAIYIAGMLPDADLGALAQGAALLSWHATHRFCSRCGQESAMRDGGYKRVCPACEAQHFPRTDPVVIMLTVTPDGDSCLFGRSPHFPEGVYSCLAGFVEPGETIEDAVRRETFEETGVKVGRVAYHASQPWPFPHTLMIGCHGEAESTAITIDDELEDARWFTRNEVGLMLDGKHPDGLKMPPRGAIAWRLVEDWARG